MAEGAVGNNRIVVADFICPTEKTREQFGADYVIWMDTIKERSVRRHKQEGTTPGFEGCTCIEYKKLEI